MTLPDPAAQAAKWALVVGLAYFSADATSALIQRQLDTPPKPMPQSSIGPVQENVPAQAPPPGLVNLLKTTQPEGAELQIASGPGSATASVTPAPTKAPSNLQLRGTMAGSGGSGLAMIDVNGQTQVVSAGEQVGGMTLTSVSSYSVTLEANGQVQILEMNAEGPVQANSAPIQSITPPPVTDPTALPTPDPNATASEAEGAGEAILTTRELRNILDNPAQFAGQGFRMKPVLNGGEIVGMRVSIQDKNHPLARLGIQDGDVVKSLNGTPLNGPEALSSIYRVLRNTSSLSFDVERGGAPQKLDITLEE